ncbi:MAG: hypothetical protein ACYSSI_01920 [Planctomycetota bacterium]|jgi:hypothetical protein
MDTAKKFSPKTILLWEKIADELEAQRIVSMFPLTQVKLIKHQRGSHLLNSISDKALIAGKRVLMIGHTSRFVGYFNGNLGANVHCCPYYCTYCYLAYVYRKYAPYIKININYDTMFKQIRKACLGTEKQIAFNAGEMLDSLALDHVTGLTTMLIPYFKLSFNATDKKL